MEEKGLRKLSTFITADALLAAVLLVWAQLWIQPFAQLWADQYVSYRDPTATELLEGFNFNVGIGLGWTYLAVLLTLMALAWVGWCSIKKGILVTPNLAIGLFLSSLTMAVLEVGQSLMSIFIKTIDTESTVFQFSTKIPTYLAIFVLISAVSIITMSILGVFRLRTHTYVYKGWLSKYYPWVIELVIIFVTVVLTLYWIIGVYNE
jgi:hypothetical protein